MPMQGWRQRRAARNFDSPYNDIKSIVTYIGEWQLIPELSLYESGVPPVDGRYIIARAGEDGLAIEVTWRMPGDSEQKSTRFGGRADGTRVPLPSSGEGPDAFSLTHVAESALDSAAYRGDTRIAYARRVASADGTLLAVLQASVMPGGNAVRNFQVYRRIDR